MGRLSFQLSVKLTAVALRVQLLCSVEIYGNSCWRILVCGMLGVMVFVLRASEEAGRGT